MHSNCTDWLWERLLLLLLLALMHIPVFDSGGRDIIQRIDPFTRDDDQGPTRQDNRTLYVHGHEYDGKGGRAGIGAEVFKCFDLELEGKESQVVTRIVIEQKSAPSSNPARLGMI